MTDRLAIEGGQPVRQKPFHPWPVFDQSEEEALLEVLHSGRWGVLNGTKVAEFEKQFASFQLARYGICVPNGTLALQLALIALGIKPGDEVITTPYTFIATASSIIHAGACPVFVDIEPGSHNLDPNLLETAITPRTRGIVPVHLAGRPADMDGILKVAQKHNLFVLEDACQAWGSEWRGKRVGAIGNAGAFSFQASKNITAGEGGIVITNDEELAERCWSIHNVGRIREGSWYQHEVLGWNLRLPEWEGAILLAQLARLPGQIRVRQENVTYLTRLIQAEVPGLVPPVEDPRITAHSHHLLILRYQPAAFGGRSRDEFIAAMVAEGITPLSGGYVPLHQSPAIRRFMEAAHLTQQPLPAAEQAGRESLWINQNVFLGNHADMHSIIEAALKIQNAWD